jgi:hypothetical protein
VGRRTAGGFDLQQPKLRRLIEARLGKLWDTLEPIGSKPLAQLTKEEVIDLFVAGVCAGIEAGADPYLLNDEIPF